MPVMVCRDSRVNQVKKKKMERQPREMEVNLDFFHYGEKKDSSNCSAVRESVRVYRRKILCKRRARLYKILDVPMNLFIYIFIRLSILTRSVLVKLSISDLHVFRFVLYQYDHTAVSAKFQNLFYMTLIITILLYAKLKESSAILQGISAGITQITLETY